MEKQVVAWTSLWLAIATPVMSSVMAAERPPEFPRIRHIDAVLAAKTLQKPARLRILLADDAPPFIYRNAGGALTGFSIALMRRICADNRIRCRFIVRPWDRLERELAIGRGDVILSPLRMTQARFERLAFTRPYWKALGGFARRVNGGVKELSGAALAGRRVGVVQNSLHARWLARNLPHSRRVFFKTFDAATQALKSGGIDALFGDWLQLAFYVQGKRAAGCCVMMPGFVPSRLFAYNHVAIATRADAAALADWLDQRLDAMQADGTLLRLARRFLPAGVATKAPTTGGNDKTGKAK